MVSQLPLLQVSNPLQDLLAVIFALSGSGSLGHWHHRSAYRVAATTAGALNQTRKQTLVDALASFGERIEIGAVSFAAATPRSWFVELTSRGGYPMIVYGSSLSPFVRKTLAYVA